MRLDISFLLPIETTNYTVEQNKHYEVRYMFLLPIETTNYTVE